MDVRREKKGMRVFHADKDCMILPRCRGDGHRTMGCWPLWGQQVPQRTVCTQVSQSPEKGQSRAGFTTADSLVLDLWGLARAQGFYFAAENKPSNRSQNSPPASWFLFCNRFSLKNVAVGTFPASQPACEWVPGTSNSSSSGERRQELSLGPGKGTRGQPGEMSTRQVWRQMGGGMGTRMGTGMGHLRRAKKQKPPCHGWE